MKKPHTFWLASSLVRRLRMTAQTLAFLSRNPLPCWQGMMQLLHLLDAHGKQPQASGVTSAAVQGLTSLAGECRNTRIHAHVAYHMSL